MFQARTLSLRAFVEETFEGCVLKDLHHGYIHYQINSTRLTWAKLFGTMEGAKVQYEIEDYSVSQTTLEQVFLNFAKNQLPPKHTESTSCTSGFTKCVSFCCCCGCCKNNATKPTSSNNVPVTYSRNVSVEVQQSNGGVSPSSVAVTQGTERSDRLSTDL